MLSGKKVRKAFEKDGWEFVRQRGSHMILVKPGSIASTVRARLAIQGSDRGKGSDEPVWVRV